jgi:hypothetical protein
LKSSPAPLRAGHRCGRGRGPRHRGVLHGIEPEDDDTAASLRERLNDLYLGEVRRLKERRQAGEIAKADYAAHVVALRNRFPLLGLPIGRWTG